MPVAPATIVRTKRSWPGHVDEREPAAVGQLERRVAEVDRDPALLLLGQPVGVLPGQRADEPRLAVVDVPGGADRQRTLSRRAVAAARTARGDLVDLVVARSVRQSSRRRPSRTTPTTGGSPRAQRRRELLLDRAGEARQLGERERAAADPRDGLLDRRRRPAARAARRARAPASAGSRSMRSTGTRARAPGRGRARACPRARRASACRRAARAGADGGGAARRGRRGRRRSPPAGRRAACRRRSRRGRRRRRGASARDGSSPSCASAPEPRSSTSGSPCRARDSRELAQPPAAR